MAGIALAYEPVDGISFPIKSEIEEYIFIDNIKFKFSINRQSMDSYPDELIYKAIYSSTLFSIREIQAMGAQHKRCSSGELVEIFEISEKELNNPSRFPEEFINNPSRGYTSLWGYYDPRPNENALDAIVISSGHMKSSSYRIVAHEIAHYWYQTFCLERFTKLNSEEFATSIQNKLIWE
jgi:hypothetical protein